MSERASKRSDHRTRRSCATAARTTRAGKKEVSPRTTRADLRRGSRWCLKVRVAKEWQLVLLDARRDPNPNPHPECEEEAQGGRTRDVPECHGARANPGAGPGAKPLLSGQRALRGVKERRQDLARELHALPEACVVAKSVGLQRSIFG